MSAPKIIKNAFKVKPTHFLVHKGTRFPFNFYIFESNSIYFQEHSKELFSKKEINILDENEKMIELTDEGINFLISFINNEEIPLTKENVPSLYFLSKKYCIPELIQETEQFIQDNNLCLQFLLFYQNNPRYSLDKFIDQLSDHFYDYIHDQSIFNLNFPILYSIIEKVKTKQTPCENISNDFYDFLFDCIDKYHREASILFKDINFDKMPMIYLQRLLKYEPSEFDSIFINNEMLKTIYEKEGELIRKEEEIKLKEKEIDEKMIRMNEMIDLFKTRIDELEEELRKQKQDHTDVMTKLQQNQQLSQTFNKIEIKYENIENAFKGIIHNLTKRCGRNVDANGVVKVTMWPAIYSNRVAKNAVDLDNLDTIAQTNSNKDSYILYDFLERRVSFALFG